jgi:N-acetylglucosamine-6-sulfatase
MPKKPLQLLFVLYALVTSFVSVASAAESDPPQDPRPSIVVVMFDDLDTQMYQQALDEGYLPQIKQYLVDQGTTFTESFVTTSLCCPSRSTFLTGRYSHNHGVFANSGPSGGFDHFDDSATMATWLQQAGYRTGHVGKYLNGYNKGSYVPPGWETWNATVSTSAYCMYNFRVSQDGLSEKRYLRAPQDYQTDVLADYAERFVRKVDERPFLLSVAPLAPHNEVCLDKTPDTPYGRIRPAPRHQGSVDVVMPMLKSPSFNEPNLRDKPQWVQRLPRVNEAAMQTLYNDKFAALRAVDDMVGRIARALQDTGREANTLFMLTSDNGYHFGTHRLDGKGVLYEEAIRVPLVIRAPGQILPRESAQWVLNTDWAPTLAEYAIATPTPLPDGRSLAPLLRDEPIDAWRQSFLIERPFDGVQTKQRFPHRALRTKDPEITGDAGGSTVLVYGESFNPVVANELTDIEFYDLLVDPYQIQSLNADKTVRRQQQQQTMKTRLESINVCTGDGCRAAED